MKNKKKNSLFSVLWSDLKDKKSAKKVAEISAYLSFYISFTTVISVFLLYIPNENNFFYKSVENITSTEKFIASTFSIFIAIVFIWLGVKILKFKRYKLVPWVCGWTLFESIIKVFIHLLSGNFAFILTIILIFLSINSIRGYLALKKDKFSNEDNND